MRLGPLSGLIQALASVQKGLPQNPSTKEMKNSLQAWGAYPAMTNH